MSEARHEAAVSIRPEAPGTRPGQETEGAAKGKQAKSGVHPTDVLQRDAFTHEALRRMAESTKPPPREPAPEPIAGASLVEARRELLRMAGEDLPVSAPSAFDAQEVTTRRAHPLLLAQSSRGSAPEPDGDRDEDTVVQDVSELLAAADAQLDALTTEIRSVVTTLPPPPVRVEPEARADAAHAERPAQDVPALVSPPPVSADVSRAPVTAPLTARAAAEPPAQSPAHDDDSVPVMLVEPPRRASAPVAPVHAATVEPSAPPLGALPSPRARGGKLAVMAAVLAVAGLGAMRVGSMAPAPASGVTSTLPAARRAAPEVVAAPAAPAAPPATPAPAELPPASAAPARAPSVLAALHEADSRVPPPGSDVASLVSRGLASLRAGQPRAARELLSAAAARTNLNPHVYAGICEADLMLGFPERALSAAQSALKLRPRRARYHRLIARVYDALGQPEEAAESRRQADIVAPYDPDQPGRGQGSTRVDE